MYIGGNGFASLDCRCLYRQNRNNAKIQKNLKEQLEQRKKGNVKRATKI